MITNLYFVRHAHSIYTPDELNRPLSERGLNDTNHVTELLINENIDIVCSSPYQRAIQTVRGIAEYNKLNIEIIDDLKERTLSSSSVDDFDSAIAKVWSDWEYSWDGGESNNTAQQRGVNSILHLLEKNAGNNIAIGTHGNIMVLIMNYFDTGYDFQFWKQLDMPDIYKLTFRFKKLINVKRIWNR